MCSRGNLLRSTFSAFNSVFGILFQSTWEIYPPGKAHAFYISAICASFGGLWHPYCCSICVHYLLGEPMTKYTQELTPILSYFYVTAGISENIQTGMYSGTSLLIGKISK